MNAVTFHLRRYYLPFMIAALLAILLLRTGVADAMSMVTCGQWNVVSSPTGPSGSDLNAVAVVSPNDVWAVGYNHSKCCISGDEGTFSNRLLLLPRLFKTSSKCCLASGDILCSGSSDGGRKA